MSRKITFVAVFGLLMSLLFESSVYADAKISVCENTHAAYYQPNLFPRFVDVHNRLVLTDLITGENLMTLAEELPYTYAFDWSPDCHYLIAHSIDYNACYPGLIIWDATNGEQELSTNRFCDTMYHEYPHIFWREDGTAALITEWYHSANAQGSSGTRLIWYPASNQQIVLQITGNGPDFLQVYWDDARGYIWGSAYDGVAAFDTHSGAQVIGFHNPPESENPFYFTASKFTFSPDTSKVILSGQHNFDRYMVPSMTVYDIITGSPIQVNVERNGAGVVALSSDNRYLVMGYDALRVWDLSNLPESLEERLPIYRYNGPEKRIIGVQIVDNSIIETVTVDKQTSHWGLFSGLPAP